VLGTFLGPLVAPAESRRRLEEAGAVLGFSSSDVTLLRDFALPSSGTSTDSLNALVQEMREADAELKRIKSTPSQRERRTSTLVRYYRKRADHGRGDNAMTALREIRGFRIEVVEPQDPDSATNAVWVITNNVATEDIRLVAYNLICAGIQIRHIGAYPHPTEVGRFESATIWVGGDPRYDKLPVLSVTSIRTSTRLQF
jgi:hypothetical protein